MYLYIGLDYLSENDIFIFLITPGSLKKLFSLVKVVEGLFFRNFQQLSSITGLNHMSENVILDFKILVLTDPP